MGVPNPGRMYTRIKQSIIAPCKNCTDRYPKCHSSCDKYVEYTRTLSDTKDKCYAHIKRDGDTCDYLRERSARIEKRIQHK